MKLPLVTIDSPNAAILRKDLSSIVTDPEEVRKLAPAVKRACSKHRGCGIAAPQLGLEMNFFYLDGRLFHPARNTFCINPSFTPVGTGTASDVEGCLSLHHRTHIVPRFSTISVAFTDLKGNEVKMELSGWAGRAFQHEFDHLLGLMIDRFPAEHQGYDT